MAVAIRQLHKHFVGEVSGLDLRQPLTKEQAREVEAGMDKYAVLIFHDQDITDEQQLAFALNFGEREKARGGTVVKKEDYRLTSGLNDVSNLGKDGKPLPRDHRTQLFNLGNCLWHSDSSFRPIPAKFSLLSARVVNPKGGVTSLTRSLAVELGREGITVNCICPGPIRSAITERIPEEHKTIYAKRRTALGRYGDPEEVAHMTLSLCLPAASYLTGAVIPVDGGLMARNA